MKILVLSNLYPPDFVGGYEIMSFQTVEALKQLGHDVHVLTSASSHCDGRFYRPESGVDRSLYLSDLWDNSPEVSIFVQHYLFKARVSNYHNTYQFLRVLRDKRPDLVYFHNIIGLGALALVELCLHIGVPHVWRLGDRAPVEISLEADSVLDLFYPGSERNFSRGVYILCSRLLYNEIRNSGVDLGSATHWVPNWVAPIYELGERNYFNGGKLRCLNASALGQHKGTDIILYATRKLLDRGVRGFHVDLFGSGNLAGFEALIEKLGLKTVVTLRGKVSQDYLEGSYSEYDVFLFPTWQREPFGIAPLQAAAYGVVPIITQGVGCTEVLQKGKEYLAIRRSPDHLAHALNLIIKGKVDLKTMGNGLAAGVRSRLSRDTLIKRVEAILEATAGEVDWDKIQWDRALRLALDLDNRARRRLSAAITHADALGDIETEDPHALLHALRGDVEVARAKLRSIYRSRRWRYTQRLSKLVRFIMSPKS